MTDKLVGYLVLGVFVCAIGLIAIQNHELKVQTQQRKQLLGLISDLMGKTHDNYYKTH